MFLAIIFSIETGIAVVVNACLARFDCIRIANKPAKKTTNAIENVIRTYIVQFQVFKTQAEINTI